jgi:hypothetical protein
MSEEASGWAGLAAAGPAQAGGLAAPGLAAWSAVSVAARDPEIEGMARELAGRCLDDVRYYSLPYGMTDKPTWDRDTGARRRLRDQPGHGQRA